MIDCNENEIKIEGRGITILAEFGNIAAYLYKLFLADGISDEEVKELIHGSVDAGIVTWGEENGC